MISSVGSILLVSISLLIANSVPVQWGVTHLFPVIENLKSSTLRGTALWIRIGLVNGIAFAGLLPLFRPHSRRILDTLELSLRRVLTAGMFLATIGYFDYTFRLPRSTLIVWIALSGILLPVWFALIRRQPITGNERAIIVGDDPAEISSVFASSELPILGFVSPSAPSENQHHALADGGQDISWLGGFARLDGVLIENDIDTAVFAFSHLDRAEFFGALAECRDHGVTVQIDATDTDIVLTESDPVGDLQKVNIEPWDWQSRVFKRIFDILFAVCGLLLFAPLIGLIAIAVKLDSPGPILYNQKRTAEFGDTFEVYKFRSMLPESENAIPGEDSSRITQVGQILRTTHLDELPQLWSILKGEMSAVGPRPAWTDEEALIQQEIGQWRKRWFVKPGLTGLAQIRGTKSTSPSKKLQYDLEYIKNQSVIFDLKIILRQIWLVIIDLRNWKKSRS